MEGSSDASGSGPPPGFTGYNPPTFQVSSVNIYIATNKNTI